MQLRVVYRDGSEYRLRASYWAYCDAMKTPALVPHGRAFWQAVAAHQDAPGRGEPIRCAIVDLWGGVDRVEDVSVPARPQRLRVNRIVCS